jgi:ABC-type Fe3+/spermidine/putrescine transport system ATPase subunit
MTGATGEASDPAVQTAPGEPTVRLAGVTKAFGELLAVHEMTLDIAKGEFFTMLGPSGCGKTTTLRMVAGFEQPTEGRILIEGTDVAGLPAHKRPTNTVFQSYALFPHLSVRENVAFGLQRKRVDKAEIGRRVEAELERVGLAAEINRRPNQLSGGMQQRVNLARALVVNPQVLLLDEPFASLDAQTREYMQQELLNIWERDRVTAIFVTHQIDEAIFLADRVLVLSSSPGRLKREFVIDIPRPRMLTVKRSAQFHEYEDAIWNEIGAFQGEATARRPDRTLPTGAVA